MLFRSVFGRAAAAPESRSVRQSGGAGESKCSAERRRRRVEVFGRAAAPESQSVWQSGGAGDLKCSAERRRGRRVEVFGRAAAAPESRSVRQSGGGAEESKCSAERRRRQRDDTASIKNQFQGYLLRHC